MDKQQKSKFIADNIAAISEKHTKEFRKENKQAIKDIQKEDNYDKLIAFMGSAVMESINVVKEWEVKEHSELDGLTVLQYYDSLDNPEDMIDLVAMFMERNDSLVSISLEDIIRKKDDMLLESILNHLESMKIDENKKLYSRQQAVVHIAELLKKEEFIEPLCGILLQLDDENADHDSIMAIMDVFRAIGQASLQHITSLIEKSQMEGIIYGHSLMGLADIASHYKNEDIYKFLKDCFRKSESKLIEASALSTYGDGRAVAAIRSFVERNLMYMEPKEYSQFREFILSLGGLVSDLDMGYREYGHIHHDHTHHDHMHHGHTHHEHVHEED